MKTRQSALVAVDELARRQVSSDPGLPFFQPRNPQFLRFQPQYRPQNWPSGQAKTYPLQMYAGRLRLISFFLKNRRKPKGLAMIRWQEKADAIIVPTLYREMQSSRRWSTCPAVVLPELYLAEPFLSAYKSRRPAAARLASAALASIMR